MQIYNIFLPRKLLFAQLVRDEIQQLQYILKVWNNLVTKTSNIPGVKNLFVLYFQEKILEDQLHSLMSKLFLFSIYFYMLPYYG